MKIGIIGAGHIGGTLTRRLRALGHDVAVANSRGPETLGKLAAETGAHAVTVREAARRASRLGASRRCAAEGRASVGMTRRAAHPPSGRARTG